MKNIAIIPARSGSKSLKNKNIKELNGIPLLAYSIEAAKKSKIFDEIMVSTDSKRYANIAKKYGANVPFLRSKENSSDIADSWDVVREVLVIYYLNFGIKFDSVCLLQPTSPLRTAKDIKDSYKLLKEKKADSVTSVCKAEHSPLWSMTLPENHSLNEFNLNSNSVPRQQLPTYYRLNGAIYIRKIKYGKSRMEILNNNDFAFIMPAERSIDIDEMLDFYIAETILTKKIK